MISLGAVFSVFVYIIVAAAIFGCCEAFLKYNSIGEPWARGARFVLSLGALIVVVYALLAFLGGWREPMFRP